jgi:hypothetical protein
MAELPDDACPSPVTCVTLDMMSLAVVALRRCEVSSLGLGTCEARSGTAGSQQVIEDRQRFEAGRQWVHFGSGDITPLGAGQDAETRHAGSEFCG